MIDVKDLINPTNVKSEIERIFNTVVTNCGNVHLVLNYIPFGDEAGGDDIDTGKGKPIIVMTVPQLEGVWQEVVNTFIDPWFKFDQIKKYIKKNDLMKFLIDDDCDTKMQIWLQFKDFLINWAYNEVMNAIATKVKPKLEEIERKQALKDETEKRPAQATEQKKKVKIPVTKAEKKPLHHNKAFVGSIGLMIASYIIQMANAHLPASVATFIASVVIMILALIDHKNFYEVKEELQEIEV